MISDNEARQADLVFLRSQLKHRVDMCKRRQATASSSNRTREPTLGEGLKRFEDSFDENHPFHKRWWRAFADLARGQALCFVDERACFLVGILEVCNVPVARERLERLVPWFEDEVCAPPTRMPSITCSLLGFVCMTERNEGVARGQMRVIELFKALSITPPDGLRGAGAASPSRTSVAPPALGRVGAGANTNAISTSSSGVEMDAAV